MSGGQIAVTFVFICFCIGGFYLIKKANTELNKKMIIDTDKEDNVNKL